MLNINEDILKNVGNQLTVPIDFSSTSFPAMEVNEDHQLFGSSKFFNISSFVFNVKRKRIQIWNDMRASKLPFISTVTNALLNISTF